MFYLQGLQTGQGQSLGWEDRLAGEMVGRRQRVAAGHSWKGLGMQVGRPFDPPW